jgi:hypothetical protein
MVDGDRCDHGNANRIGYVIKRDELVCTSSNDGRRHDTRHQADKRADTSVDGVLRLR